MSDEQRILSPFTPFAETTGAGHYTEHLVLSQNSLPEFIDLDISIHTELNQLEALWKEFEREAIGTVFQSWAWVSCWQKRKLQHAKTKTLFIVGRKGTTKAPLFIWPLQMKTRYGLKTLQWYAQEHSSYNMGLYAADAFALLRPNVLHYIFRKITEHEPNLALIDFSNQPENWQNYQNPFRSLPYHLAPNAFYNVTLQERFEDLFQSAVSAKSRSNIRRNEKKLHSAGVMEILYAQNGLDAKAILASYFKQKEKQFSEQGIKNVFADILLQEFYYDLCSYKINTQPALQCRALSVNGNIEATSIGIDFQKRHYLLMLSMTTGPFKHMAPGRILIRHEIEACCNAGHHVYDMGAGAGQHKAEWSDQSCSLIDTFIPLTIQGWGLMQALKAKRSIKRMIKNNQKLWNFAKNLRSKFNGKKRKSKNTMT